MCEQSADWAEDFIGRRFDTKLAHAHGWHDQGSGNIHFGVPVQKNLWVKSFHPENACSHVTVLIFLLIILDDAMVIQEISFRVDQVFNDGHGESMNLDLFPPDEAIAIQEIRSVLFN